MNHRTSSRLIATLLATIAIAACNAASGPLGTVPVASSAPEPSVDQASPDITPAPSVETNEQPTFEPSGSTGSPAPSSGSTGTTLVRAYFWLGGDPGSAGLVAVLRTVPGTKAVATAAVGAVLAGPTPGESALAR